MKKHILFISLLFLRFPTIFAQTSCSCPLGYAEIGSGAGVSTLAAAISAHLIASAAASTYTPQLICIKGTLAVQNLDYTFYTSSIRMGPDAEINISSNGTLTFDNTTVEACTDMWKHIEVSGTGKLKSYASTIKDGKEAFRIKTLAHVVVKGTDFINNRISISLTNTTPNTLGLVVLDDVFEGNNFETSGGLKYPYTGQTGFAGIQNLAIAGFTVGSSNGSASPNTFTNLQNGIVASKASLAVYGASFTDIKELANSSGIRLDGKCGGVFAQNNFDDCNHGLNSFNSYEINFSNNTLDDIRRIGVFVTATLATNQGKINIQSNNINTLSSSGTVGTRGVSVDHAKRLNISNNTIYVGNGSSTYEEYSGMFLNGSLFTSMNPATVSENTIIAYNGADGIHWGTGSYTITENNSITLEEPSSGASNVTKFAIGILQGSNDNAITRGNTILGYGTTDNFTTGIQTISGNKMDFCCNGTNLTNKGFDYFGTGTLWRIAQTSFGTHSIGLRVQGNSSFTKQDNTGNQWLGSYGVAGAEHTGSISSVIFDTRFIVNPFSSPYKPNVVSTPNAPGATWFTNGGGTALTCNYYSLCASDIDPEPPLDDFDITIARDSFITGTPEEAVMRWWAERGLYKRLQADTSLLSADTSLANFYTANDTTKVGLYQDVENSIEALEEESYFSTKLRANNDAIFDFLSQLVQKDSAMVGASVGTVATLAAQKSIVTDSIYLRELANDLIADSLQAVVGSLVSTIQSQNAALVASNIYEYNEKTVNEIFLDYILTNDLDTIQLDTLVAIASQCPLQGGKAVFKARALYLLKVQAVFEDGIICDTIINRESVPAMKLANTRSDFYLQPNPAMEEVTLVFGTHDALQYPDKVTITSMFGQEVASIAVQEKTENITLSLHQIPVGIYLVRSSVGNSTIGIRKLVIAR